MSFNYILHIYREPSQNGIKMATVMISACLVFGHIRVLEIIFIACQSGHSINLPWHKSSVLFIWNSGQRQYSKSSQLLNFALKNYP
jgi:hypothetical protein